MIQVEVEGLKEGVEEIAKRLTDYALLYMEAGAKKDAPLKTGNLANNIYIKKTGDTSGEVVSPTWYSGYLEYGTAAHIIVPKTKKALRWEDAGGEHFSKKVHHPGISVGDEQSPRVIGGGHTMPFMRPQVYKFMAHASSKSAEDWKAALS